MSSPLKISLVVCMAFSPLVLLWRGGAPLPKPVDETVTAPTSEDVAAAPPLPKVLPAFTPTSSGRAPDTKPAVPRAVPVAEPPIVVARVLPASPMPMYEAVVAHDFALVERLSTLGLPVQFETPERDTPLCAALRLKHDDMALWLIEKGADLNAPGLGGQRPLAVASLRRHPTVVQTLLEKGADPNKPLGYPIAPDLLDWLTPLARLQLKKERGITPLMACSARGDVEAVTLLLKHGARTQAHTMPSYRYAINMAAEQRYLFIMRLLLGRDPDTEPQILITVDIPTQTAWVEREGKPLLRTTISTGKEGHETPAGRFVITNKYKEWTSTIYKVPMPYFLRLNCSAIGLHSGYVTGSPASHGCIRLPNEMAKKIFSLVNVGDEVVILQ